jgi:hypothetical protein
LHSASCKALEEKIQQSTALMSIATKERDIISHTKRQLDESIVAMQTTMMLLQDPLSTGQEVEMLRSDQAQPNVHTNLLYAAALSFRCMILECFSTQLQGGEARKRGDARPRLVCHQRAHQRLQSQHPRLGEGKSLSPWTQG